ncbi:MBL fold metallo-hydrolase [Vandammella animalimorsus]|uniref:MBL fold metallo-hydrolase n=1 Tax=Vandammella animalimorsus TaxID=2029117 RepID=A0A2A2T2T6_9BURK|nr:MBL fold metallo-hydrolase [Vandammella animalimorsus]PAT31290.1 MBL fold metallo-hydrolase [Vandammella animalimorsus]PAX15750.1 MBL fold metallo-hydrolase [Vandammella animalimorsus]PAX19634.1 MBL fold metallo-hydrolase [Vandammella animalimorsus]
MSQTKQFASQADLDAKQVSFSQISEHAWAYTAEGDPNTGVIIGDDAVLVADTQATPAMAQDVIRRIRQVTDKPIRYVVLTHYHAVRVLGASAYGADHVLASQDTYDLIVERGEQDKASEIARFPRLFAGVETVPPGMTWPTITFTGKMTLWLGKLEVQLLQLGRGHTKGDTVVWLPQERALLSGDLVEFGATPYAGDAYFKDWPQTLDRLATLQPQALVPGRGAALTTPETIAQGIGETRSFITDVRACVQQGVQAGKDLKTIYQDTMTALRPKYGHWVIFEHCMPFDVTRCYDELTQYPDPRIWTAQRDLEMWRALEG